MKAASLTTNQLGSPTELLRSQIRARILERPHGQYFPIRRALSECRDCVVPVKSSGLNRDIYIFGPGRVFSLLQPCRKIDRTHNPSFMHSDGTSAVRLKIEIFHLSSTLVRSFVVGYGRHPGGLIRETAKIAVEQPQARLQLLGSLDSFWGLLNSSQSPLATSIP